MAIVRELEGLGSLVLPALLLAGLAGVMAVNGRLPGEPVVATSAAPPETVTIAPRTILYRASGQFQRGTAEVDGPLRELRSGALEIMVYQVSVAEYERCVADGACAPAAIRGQAMQADMPVTGVNFDDAENYAQWLSAATGETWRLPSDSEWVFAAGSRFSDDAVGVSGDAGNPADRWLARYAQEAMRGADVSAMPEPLGSFGMNEYGVADLGGSIWEWTSTCHSRTSVDDAGKLLGTLQSCGVRIVEGRHRTGMSSFIRDARSGGCTVGAPPDNLGFRLVRERGWLERLAGWFSGAEA